MQYLFVFGMLCGMFSKYYAVLYTYDFIREKELKLIEPNCLLHYLETLQGCQHTDAKGIITKYI